MDEVKIVDEYLYTRSKKSSHGKEVIGINDMLKKINNKNRNITQSHKLLKLTPNFESKMIDSPQDLENVESPEILRKNNF